MNLLRCLGDFLAKAVPATALMVFLTFIGAPCVRAEKYDACQKHLAKADHKLHEAIEHHGYRSRQAATARPDVRATRDRCLSAHHGWWKEEARRWHTERDWDENDHKRYRHQR